MDETEVQVEIACWAQEHPEASSINWDTGNEPWVDFSGQRCTLHLGLGGLIWNIEVPIGYQTEIDAGDGKRKRLWEPLDYHDTVIVQCRSTPFHVSVVDRSNNILELCNVLGQGVSNNAVAGRSCDELQLQKVHDMFKTLQLNQESTPDTAGVRKEGGKALRIITDAYFEALRRSETLAEVLDGIHGLAKLYNSQKESATDPALNAEGTFLEDEDDEHLFGSEMFMKWSTIAAQVNYAREACALARSLSVQHWAESHAGSGTVSEENVRGLPVSFPSRSVVTDEATFRLENLTLASPPRSQSGPSTSSDDDYTFLLPGLSALSTDGCEDSKPQQVDDDASGLNDFQVDSFRYDSDSDKSDSSWEIPGLRNEKSSSSRETVSPAVSPTVSLPDISWPVTEKASAKCREGPADGVSPPKRMKVEQRICNQELQWCEIAFNPVSFSIECTLRLSEFMDNLTVATALGFSLENPLRVEVVPNKSHVDSLSWVGAVEVYVSQHSDWHNHISEEICGLLCLIPNIVQSYFHANVPSLVRNHSELGTIDFKGDLFVGLLQTLVRKLTKVNAGGSCCVCNKPADPPTLLHMQGRSLWPCNDNLCLATYSTWEEVSSVDSQEREREENSSLSLMEESMKETFSYAEMDALQAALEVYGVNAINMNYGQAIKALARIELWNQKDPDSSTLSYPVF